MSLLDKIINRYETRASYDLDSWNDGMRYTHIDIVCAGVEATATQQVVWRLQCG